MTDSGLCKYRLVVWSNFNLLHSSQWIIFSYPEVFDLVLFYARLLHQLIMWLAVSFFFFFFFLKIINTWILLHKTNFRFNMIGPYGAFGAVLNTGKSSSTFFSWYTSLRLQVFCIVFNFLFLLSIYYYYYLSNFFTLALADSLSLESESQQISSGVKDSSRYSGPTIYFSLDRLDSSSNFPLF